MPAAKCKCLPSSPIFGLVAIPASQRIARNGYIGDKRNNTKKNRQQNQEHINGRINLIKVPS